jgi:hypothetical protein
MSNLRTKLACLAVVSFVAIQISFADPRILSITPTPRLIPPPKAADYIHAVDLAYNSGARGQLLSWHWSQLEPSPGVFDLQEVDDQIYYLGEVRGFEFLVRIDVIDTTSKVTPSDLLNAGFNSPLMRTRFHALVDALKPHLRKHVLFFSVGNEVDVYLGAHPGQWPAFIAFYQDAISYIHQRLPKIPVGVTATFGGAIGPDAPRVRKLNDPSDVLVLTYYPSEASPGSNGPIAPFTDFPQMMALGGARKVVLQEVGFPTSNLLGSSQQKQADFVTNVFKAWNTTGPQIPFLNFFAMGDLTQQVCTELSEYYGVPNDPYFKAFLCSLGLRRSNGVPKLGWQAYWQGARAFSTQAR